MRSRPLLFCVFILCPLAHGCQTPQADHVGQSKSAAPLRDKGVMEKKFESLTRDMTKADVEAVLGQPSGCLRGGGSLSLCEQYDYSYQGEDGSISITFRENGAARDTLSGPPGMQSRINTMDWHPKATQN
jgi:hypothetical protein